MEYCMMSGSGGGGCVENIILAEPFFAEKIGALPSYPGAKIGDPYDPPAAALTPAEQRKKIYETEPLISWEGEQLTVTQAAQLWQYYAAEGNVKSYDIQRMIAEAKASIREQYPDEEVQS